MFSVQHTNCHRPIAFSVIRSNDFTVMSETARIDFDGSTLPVEDTNAAGFDLSSDTFKPPASGLYWLHFSVGLPQDLLTDVQLAGIHTHTPNIVRSAPGALDTTSRCELVALTSDVDVLTLTSSGALYSDASGVQTSWSGFHLDNAMSSTVAFSVGLSTSQTTTGTIAFDTVLVDTHGGWKTSHYVIPESGVWVVTLNCGDYPGSPGSGYTFLFLGEVRARVSHGWSGKGVDVDSITVVLGLTAGETIRAQLVSPPVYSDANYQTSMLGFLYSPLSQPSVAWCVSLAKNQVGPQNAVLFYTVLINEGNGWNSDTSIFKAPIDGVYYVTLTGLAMYGVPMKLDLLLNGVQQADVLSADAGYNRSRGRALILRLNSCDELRVHLAEGYSVAGDTIEVRSTFAGFRIS